MCVAEEKNEKEMNLQEIKGVQPWVYDDMLCMWVSLYMHLCIKSHVYISVCITMRTHMGVYTRTNT